MYKIGDRIELVSMLDDPNPIEAGTKGTIRRISPDPFSLGCELIGVDWDNGRTLNICTEVDQIKIIN